MTNCHNLCNFEADRQLCIWVRLLFYIIILNTYTLYTTSCTLGYVCFMYVNVLPLWVIANYYLFTGIANLSALVLTSIIYGRVGLLHNKPVQGLRLTNCITGITPNRLKIDRSLYQLGDRSPILMATSDYLPVIHLVIYNGKESEEPRAML